MKIRRMKGSPDLLYPCGHPVGCWRRGSCAWCRDVEGFRKWGCTDCGVDLKRFQMDTLIPTKQWKMLKCSGILCANCMIRRAKAHGALSSRMQFLFKGSEIAKWARPWRE